MSFWDRLLGRTKKTAGETTGDTAMASEGMHQEQEAQATERAEQADDLAQQAREEAAEHRAERPDQP